MIEFTPEGENAVSFTDETSLPFAELHVSIHAQILRDDTHSWYFELRRLAQNGQAEFKSQAVRIFFELSADKREKVFRTLRRARIHIMDPRPYAKGHEEQLRKILPREPPSTNFSSSSTPIPGVLKAFKERHGLRSSTKCCATRPPPICFCDTEPGNMQTVCG
jgi:hypothetical protein